MENKKIKVVWICHLSNEKIRENLHLKSRANKNALKDFAQWNTNGIDEFKNFDDIELHIISPHMQLSSKLEEFVNDKVPYHIGNKLCLQLESYMSVCETAGAPVSEAIDGAISNGLFGAIGSGLMATAGGIALSIGLSYMISFFVY